MKSTEVCQTHRGSFSEQRPLLVSVHIPHYTTSRLDMDTIRVIKHS